VDGLGDHHLSCFLSLPKIICAIQTRVHKTCSLHHKPQSIIEKFPSRISSVSLFQSDIFQPKMRTCLYLKMHPLVLSKVIELSLVNTVTGQNIFYSRLFVSPLPLLVPEL
jgi:hypothetical protein